MPELLTRLKLKKHTAETKFSLELTGQQGDVMKESMKSAKTIAWNLLPQEIKNKFKMIGKIMEHGVYIYIVQMQQHQKMDLQQEVQ